MNQILKLKDATHLYSKDTGAKNISIEIKPGEVVGFIGPNGAGKSTTIRMIMGFIELQQGSIELLGEKVQSPNDFTKISNEIGFLSAETNYYKGFKSSDIIEFTSNFYNNPKEIKSKAKELAIDLELDVFKKVEDLSTGNKQKLGIILSLMHSPKLIIMDEPTSGLDPLVQQKVVKHLLEAKRAGSAILLSSHVLTEVEQVCDRIIMIKNAEIILQEKTEEITSKSKRKFVIKDSADIAKYITQQGFEANVINTDIIIYSDNYKELIKLLISKNIYNFYIQQPPLEDMFMDLYK